MLGVAFSTFGEAAGFVFSGLRPRLQLADERGVVVELFIAFVAQLREPRVEGLLHFGRGHVAAEGFEPVVEVQQIIRDLEERAAGRGLGRFHLSFWFLVSCF